MKEHQIDSPEKTTSKSSALLGSKQLLTWNFFTIEKLIKNNYTNNTSYMAL